MGGGAVGVLIGVGFFLGEENRRRARCVLLGDAGGVGAGEGAEGSVGVLEGGGRGTEKWIEKARS